MKQTQHPHDDGKGPVIAGGPVQRRVRLIAEGGEHRHDHHGQQPAGEPHVIEIQPVLDLIGVSRQGGQDKADHHAGNHAQQQAGVDAAQGHIAYQRGQRRSQQGHAGVFAEGLLLIFGIEPGPQNDGPDIEEVLAKQGEARHQPHLHQGETVERLLRELDEEDGDDGHQAQIDQGGAHAGDVYIVGNQQILHGHDAVQARQDIGRVVHQHAKQHQ